MTRKIETIEDVHEALAEVREALAAVNAADLTQPEAKILYGPLLDLSDQLRRLQGDMMRLATDVAAQQIHEPEEER